MSATNSMPAILVIPIGCPAVMHGNPVKGWQNTTLLHAKMPSFRADIKIGEFAIWCVMNPPEFLIHTGSCFIEMSKTRFGNLLLYSVYRFWYSICATFYHVAYGAGSVVPQTKVPISCTKAANYNSIFINMSLTVCQKKRHAFFLCVLRNSVIVVLVAIDKKRERTSFSTTSSFLSSASTASSAICRIYVLLGLASLLTAVTSTLLW